MKKKLLSYALIIAVCASLAGCGGSSSGLQTPVGESSESSTGFEGLEQAAEELEEATESMAESMENWTEESSETEEPAETAEESGDLSSAFDVQDVLIKHESYLTETEERYDQFITIFYGNDTETLKALFLEVSYKKSAGITKENLEGADINSLIPGFDGMSFADFFIDENDDRVSLVVRFRDLDNMDNAKAMHDAGLITLDRTVMIEAVDARTIMDDLENQGFEKVELLDYTTYNLHFNLD